MIVHRDTLLQALDEIRAGTLSGAVTIIMSRSWWEALSINEQNTYRSQAEGAGVELRVDDLMSSHFVEVRGDDAEPPLSTEHPL